MTGSLDALLDEHAELERALAVPSVHADAARARKLGRRYAELGPVVAAARELATARDDEAAAKELVAEDPSFADEVREQHARVERLETRLADLLVPRDPHDGDAAAAAEMAEDPAIAAELPGLSDAAEHAAQVLRRLLVPRDPDDARDVILEVKAGEGGEESALFAGDLLRMYLRYAEHRGWKAEILGGTDSDLGGYKDVTLLVRSRASDPDGVWAALKFEGGVHRVQRVPVTESQGRVHTSAAGVLVYPDTGDEAALEIDEKDLRVDVFRSSGHGGQSVNTTDSAVRITHLPTGIVVSCQNERSQLQNRARAMEVLRSRLQALAEEEAAAKASADRRSQVRTVDRSERIRTYNFPENRISDHRIGYKAHNLSAVLDGDLGDVLAALAAAERAQSVGA
ncbi:MAG: peptide chain release factor 1 [Pseudonocardia sp.]